MVVAKSSTDLPPLTAGIVLEPDEPLHPLLGAITALRFAAGSDIVTLPCDMPFVPAALLAFLTDINAIGLEAAQGLYLTAGWYWDLDDKSRAFAKRFFDKVHREPTFPQAAYYSATLTYLNAVKAVGSTDPNKVMAELHKTKIDDMFTSNGVIRADGLLEHDMYIMQVKTPAESKAPWDYYKLVQTMKGEDAYGKLSDSACPLVKQ